MGPESTETGTGPYLRLGQPLHAGPGGAQTSLPSSSLTKPLSEVPRKSSHISVVPPQVFEVCWSKGWAGSQGTKPFSWLALLSFLVDT